MSTLCPRGLANKGGKARRMAEKGMCDRGDGRAATTEVRTKAGVVWHLCDWCADQWDEDYADDDDEKSTTL
jgi:hypothetical protein